MSTLNFENVSATTEAGAQSDIMHLKKKFNTPHVPGKFQDINHEKKVRHALEYQEYDDIRSGFADLKPVGELVQRYDRDRLEYGLTPDEEQNYKEVKQGYDERFGALIARQTKYENRGKPKTPEEAKAKRSRQRGEMTRGVWIGEALTNPETFFLTNARKGVVFAPERREPPGKQSQWADKLKEKRHNTEKIMRGIFEVEDAQRPALDVIADIKKKNAELAAAGTPKIERLMKMIPSPRMPSVRRPGELELPLQELWLENGRRYEFLSPAVFVWLFQDELNAKLEAMVCAAAGPSLSDKERKARLDKLFDELLENDREEEALVFAMRTAGMQVERLPLRHPLALLELKIVEPDFG
jgi:hypothetical protein